MSSGVLLLIGAGLGFGVALGAALVVAVVVLAVPAHLSRQRAVQEKARHEEDYRIATIAWKVAKDMFTTWKADFEREASQEVKEAIELRDAELHDFSVIRERLDESIARRIHVREGGRLDDSPTKWKSQK